MTRMPTLYIPHGGGPCFFMDWNPADVWTGMGEYLRDVARQVGQKPKAILVISAHWEEAEFTLQTAQQPDLLFDYYGFPPHTYQITYPTHNDAQLMARIGQLTAQAGITLNHDDTRGYDHGVFIPLKLIYPDADIPVAQLSLKKGLDPAEHIRLGQALAPLRDEGVLIIGSGMSFHNMKALMGRGVNLAGQAHNFSHDFDNWLKTTATEAAPLQRIQNLTHWTQAPAARDAHPREEHLIPLMVVAGAAGEDKGTATYSQTLPHINAAISGYQFG
ncbi:class III extradiol ring-cleavage dioxygenase [Asticcacaulis sp. ZE23SCel15]|uniref:DODA-type extradiol aromatic ring-opening family dioxygenase n=1 Tax=Asticcacaulis sp. ZE23SCel15 TaxID=3059027 RepID=UPI00265FBDDA|nr:class III extradiol ring-cleavage dioxygenase [Asticcacaulis sp. ZE23SCel15]WKL58069.1 class III extradiol ring-cleavage dioxygenase [Asticcacaulis sp. ZE23SCel15]